MSEPGRVLTCRATQGWAARGGPSALAAPGGHARREARAPAARAGVAAQLSLAFCCGCDRRLECGSRAHSRMGLASQRHLCSGPALVSTPPLTYLCLLGRLAPLGRPLPPQRPGQHLQPEQIRQCHWPGWRVGLAAGGSAAPRGCGTASLSGPPRPSVLTASLLYCNGSIVHFGLLVCT